MMTAPPVSDAVAIGVDVGGTNVRVAGVAADGSVTRAERRSTPYGDADGLVAAIAAGVASFPGELPLGVGIAGGVTGDGQLRGAPNLGIDGVRIGDLLRSAIGRSATVINDASAATWAEHRIGAARDVADVVLLTLGTGVGGGVVVRGQLLGGATGLAGELGHIIVDEGGAPCPCGNRGCLEAYASGNAMRLGDRSSTEVETAARSGDEDARAHLASVGTWVGVGAASLCAVLDPALIVLGGGAGSAVFDLVAPSARAALASRLFAREHRDPPPIVAAELGDTAGVVGAALLALDSVHGQVAQ
jgi:glucokinase